jgi:hypothetical protein
LTTLTRLRLATLLLLTTLLLTRFLIWILIHSLFLSNVASIASPLRSLVFHSKSQSAANAFVPRFTLRQCLWNLSQRVEFLCNRENQRWDVTCFCGCLGCRFRFWC